MNTWEQIDWKTERLVAPDGRILAEVADSYTRSETSVTIIGRHGYYGKYNTRENAKRAAEKALAGDGSGQNQVSSMDADRAASLRIAGADGDVPGVTGDVSIPGVALGDGARK